MSHRVKNSLASVVGLPQVRSRSTLSDQVRDSLQEAGSRVATIAQVHDHLWRGSRIGFIDLADFINEFCRRLQGAAGTSVLRCRADPILLSAGHAISLGLLINELVTNAVKHGYPDGGGVVDISAHEINGSLRVEVSDRGIGLPEGFDINQPRTSLGLRVITGLVRQLHGHLTVTSNEPSGAHFLFELPILPNEGQSLSAKACENKKAGSMYPPLLRTTCLNTPLTPIKPLLQSRSTTSRAANE